jgi:hypothetical protein
MPYFKLGILQSKLFYDSWNSITMSLLVAAAAAVTAAVTKCFIIVCLVSFSLIPSIVSHLGVEIFADDCTLGEVMLHCL